MINEYPSVTGIPGAEWNDLLGPDLSDLDHAYLTFRERLEPGDPVALVHENGVAHAVTATTATGLFSHPGKLLADDQFLRAGPDDDDVRKQHRSLVDAARPVETLDGALVVRGFDRSALPADETATEALVAALQQRAPAVVFPFVDPGDALLRTVLAAAGFRHGVVTATSEFDLTGVTAHDGFLAALPSKHRRHHLKETGRLADAGLAVAEVPLADHLDEVADLEARNGRKHGGSPDVARLRAARALMAELLPGGVRVPAVHQDGRMIACGVHLALRSSYHILGYGCDYTVSERSTAYQCVTFYDPIRYCLENGLTRCRLGFEGFEAKHQRGARVRPRELWLRTTGDDASLADLLGLLDERNTAYLAQF